MKYIYFLLLATLFQITSCNSLETKSSESYSSRYQEAKAQGENTQIYMFFAYSGYTLSEFNKRFKEG